MSPQNPQYDNVGNLGDIIKHAALITLARLLNNRYQDAPINYLDTHTFLHSAPCANPQWNKEVFHLAEKYPAYRTYIDSESGAVRKDMYTCSLGLILENLAHSRLYLAESDGETRRKLRRQLADLSCEPALLLDDMHKFLKIDGFGNPAPLLALMDSFSETQKEWNFTWRAARHVAEALRAPDSDGIFVIFQGGKYGFHPWPEPPNGFKGPLATIVDKRYSLAVYATTSIKESVCKKLAGLGWQTSPS